jgi:predicted ATP-grasp superfamily ATP-dependent carboligase
VQRADSYLSCLERILERAQVDVVVASADATVALVREHRGRIERHAPVALARGPALDVAVNKERTLAVATGLGVDVPRAVAVGAPGDAPAAVRAIGLPAVVKPVKSWVRGNGWGFRLTSQLVTTPDEACRAVEALTRYGSTALFQQFLPGRCEAVSLLYARGTMYARFAQWAKRMEPPLGGTSVWRQSIAVPADIGSQAERLVREIDLEGYSEVEFRRDTAGRPYLMEINPRLSASVEVAVRAGVDFPYLLYQWASGRQIDRVVGYRTGYWMRYLAGDLRTTAAAVRQHGRPGVLGPATAIREFLTAFCVPAGYDYLNWTDPLPACVAVAGFARYAVGRLVSTRARRKT